MRILLLPGPSKTGTTHVQRFIASNAEFFSQHGWLWPPCPFSTGHASAGGFANLMNALVAKDSGCGKKKDKDKDGKKKRECISPKDPCTKKYLGASPDEIRDFYKKMFAEAQKNGLNVVFSAEHFSGVGGELGPAIFSALRSVLPFNGGLASRDGASGLEVATVVRDPREAQLRSIYAQSSQGPPVTLGGRSRFVGPFRGWLCNYFSQKSRITPNPLGLAAAYIEAGASAVAVVDAGGAEEDGVDLADAIACGVMGVPCKDGKVIGIEGERRRDNVRAAETSDVGEEENRQLREILEALDCSYYDYFINKHANITKILHRRNLFREKCRGTDPLIQVKAYAKIKDLVCDSNVSPQPNTTVSIGGIWLTATVYLVVGNALGLLIFMRVLTLKKRQVPRATRQYNISST